MFTNYSKGQKFFIVALRILIGWHFTYEGFLKLINSGWSGKGYLLSSQGFLSPIFRRLGSDLIVGIVDPVTIVLILGTGLTLLLGIYTKIGALCGMFLLALFYLSHPSFPGMELSGASEGNYFIVNKNLIELFALGIIYYFPSVQNFGLEAIIHKNT